MGYLKPFLTLYVAILLAAAINGQSPRADKPAKADRTVAFCELLNNPARYQGKKVRFEAAVTANLFMPALLFDHRCAEISALFTFDKRKNKVSELKKAVDEGYLVGEDGGKPKRFKFVGTLRRNMSAGPAINGLPDYYTIVVASAQKIDR
jgi:fructose-specific component phosphotransferase system IIB-like protein